MSARYRYLLERSGWMGGDGTLVWVMLNPSTADDRHDDPTITRVKASTLRHGYAMALVVNLYAVRATDPKALAHEPDPEGPLNREAWADAFASARNVAIAWGGAGRMVLGHDRVKAQEDDCLRMMRAVGQHPLCLGVNRASNTPRHPLYCPANLVLHPYPRDLMP